jgi:hypothetical protein
MGGVVIDGCEKKQKISYIVQMIVNISKEDMEDSN